MPALMKEALARLNGRKMPEEETGQRVLRDAIAVLHLPAEEQLRVNGPGCVACDLISDFEIGRSFALDNAPNLTEEQRGLLDRIDATIEGMQVPDFECFNDEVLRRPVWQQLRELAAETLQAFGWERVTVRPFEEIEPGVWHRPFADT